VRRSSDFLHPDVYLQLGENKTFKVVLSEESNQLQEVVVKASKKHFQFCKELGRKQQSTQIKLKRCHLCQEISLILQD
jgi:hypothetical protein